jgi:hypothetical protein
MSQKLIDLLEASISVKIENKRYILITALTMKGAFEVQCESYTALDNGFEGLLKLITNA